MDLANQFKETLPTFYYVAVFLGAAAIIPYFYTIITGALNVLFRKRLNLKQRYGEGAWALITGSSEGIVRAIATELAKQGINILLLSRTESKLQSAQSQLSKAFPDIKVEYIVADIMAQGRKQNQNDILPQLSRYDISILVNNAGEVAVGKYNETPVEKILNLVHINCFSAGALTHRYVRIFKEKIARTGKKCAIINVGSMAGEIALPIQVVYSASKAYMDKLTKNLAQQHPQIDFLSLRPASVSTLMTCHKKLDIFTVSSTQCAVGTINDLGQDLSTNGHYSHKILSLLYNTPPYQVFIFIWMHYIVPRWLKLRQQFKEEQSKNQNQTK